MKKVKIIVGICAFICVLLIAQLSIAKSNFQNLDIQPDLQAQGSFDNSQSVQSQVTQENSSYRTVETVVIEQGSN